MLLAILQVGLMIVAPSPAFVARTKVGVHCPTAAVQVVQEVETKSCCPTKIVERAPKLGERDFKQCQCAEKKSGKQEAEKESLTGQGERFTGLPLVARKVSYEKQWLVRDQYLRKISQLTERPSEPFIPPPNFI